MMPMPFAIDAIADFMFAILILSFFDYAATPSITPLIFATFDTIISLSRIFADFLRRFR
jgi:hypothetical protein